MKLNSELHASTVSRDKELQALWEDEAGTPTDGPRLRTRSKSAPPDLSAAKKYGRQLRTISDGFDNLLDKGVMKRLKRDGQGRPKPFGVPKQNLIQSFWGPPPTTAESPVLDDY